MAVSEAILIDAGVQVGLVDKDHLPDLRLAAKRERLKLLEVVTRSCRFPKAALFQALADVRGMVFLRPEDLTPDAEICAQIPDKLMMTRLMLPVKAQNGGRLLALGDPDDRFSLERAERATGQRFQAALADPDALRAAIAAIRSGGRGPGAMEGTAASDPVQLLDDIMKEVYLRRVSDVHFEPVEEGMRIRMRVDGQMQDYPALLGPDEEEGLMNRIKVLSGLDIAEQRMAQDGAMAYAVSGWDLPETDIRVATIPTRWGERCTMRILGEETGLLSLEQLGMSRQMLDEFRKAISRPYGMILVTGPTGSGKSTTLYAAIRELDVNRMNILTAEDPVEQSIDGVSQVQVSGKVTFAQALRSFLRHDPDVILVGEIRDRETVDIGLRAAMTGHLVLSTLHTNDAVGAVTRLADIGAERFLIGSTLVGVLAQRLVRRLCPHCRKERPATAEELAILGKDPDSGCQVYGPQGCSFCLGTGFKGRIGIFEALWINRDLRLAIAEGAGERQIHKMATSLRTLWQDCCAKVAAGEVSLSEVLHLRPEGV